MIGPEKRTICFLNRKRVYVFTTKKGKSPLINLRWELINPFLRVEEEHKPVPCPFVTLFRDVTEAVQSVIAERQADLLFDFTAGAFIRRLADGLIQLAADR